MREGYSNRREFHRIEYKKKVNLHFRKNNYPHHQIENVSLVGMFVTGEFHTKKEDKCQIYFFLSEKNETRIFRSLAQVVRLSKDGIALCFKSMPLESYKNLLIILVENSEFPESFLCEFSKHFPFDIKKI